MMLPWPEPEAGLTVSHGTFSLALHVKVPPPELLMVNACVAGLLPPCWAVKEKLVGLAPMAGGIGAAVTVNVTGRWTLAPLVRVNVSVVV
jgi:hypothetical protein